MEVLLFDRYRILREIGEGAQSKVFLVRDLQNQEALKVAKILKAEENKRTPDNSLIQEFHILESLDHESLVRVHECRISPKDQTPVLITEYVENPSDLKTFLPRLSFNQKVQVAYQMISALRYLHRKKVIHGDLKPSNILLTEQPEVESRKIIAKLIDFGVSLDLTKENTRRKVGTPLYLAPEVASEGLLPASDFYSLGTILYMLFVHHRLPYRHLGFAEIIDAHLSGMPLFKPEHFEKTDLPDFLKEFIQTCLSTDPYDRPRSLDKILSRLRFEYPELKDFAISNSDTRIREFIGMDEPLNKAREFLFGSKGTSGDNPNRDKGSFLFVSAPSGGGKSRFLHEISKIFKNKRRHFLNIPYRKKRFWGYATKVILHQFSDTRTGKRMRVRLLKTIHQNHDHKTSHLLAHFLNELAHELGGLTLAVDGLDPVVPVTFVNVLKSLTKLNKTSESSVPHKIAIILTVTQQNLQESNPTRLRADFRLADSSTPKEDPLWEQIPDQLKPFAMDGSGSFLFLPPWEKAEVQHYLSDVFFDHELSEKDIELLALATKGNPGLLQAISTKKLNTDHSADKNISGLGDNLSELISETRVFDIQVYKLKFYSDQEKTLLSLVAGLNGCHLKWLQETWGEFFGAEAVHEVRRTLMKAFDDEIIEVSMSGQRLPLYEVTNPNVISTLRHMNQDVGRFPGYLLHKVLRDEAKLLDQRQTLYLSRFLDNAEKWAASILHLFSEDKRTVTRLELAPLFDEFRIQMTSSIGTPLDSDTHIQIDMASVELAFLRRNFEEGETYARKLLQHLKNRNDLFARRICASTQMNLAILLGAKNQFEEATDLIKAAIHSNALSLPDRHFALGTLAFWELRQSDSETAEDNSKDLLRVLREARETLRKEDPVRSAILTQNLGSFFYSNGRNPNQALPYLHHASRIFQQHGEITRYIFCQRRIARIYYLLGRYTEALNVLSETLPLAESMNLNTETCEILLYITRTHYMMGNYRKFIASWLHLASLCKRTEDDRPLAALLELAVHVYLDSGQVDKAKQLVQSHRKFLGENKQEDPIALATTELLYVRIYQTVCRWDLAKKHSEFAAKQIEKAPLENDKTQVAQMVLEFYQNIQIENDNGPQAAFENLHTHLMDESVNEFLYLETLFRGFHLAAAAGNSAYVEEWLPLCRSLTAKVPHQQRLLFQIDLAQFYLTQGNLGQAQRATRKATALLNVVSNHLIRAQLFDLQTRLATEQENYRQAQTSWQQADQAYAAFIRSWKTPDRQHFLKNSPEWQTHIGILTNLRAQAA